MPVADHTLAEWLASEAGIKARHLGAGTARPEQLLPLSGEQIFDAMLAGQLPAAPIGQTLDFVLIEARRGRAIFQGQPLAAHANPMGTVHGGWISTLLDSALACAVHCTLPPGKAYTTLELKVNFVKALTPRVPRVRAIGELLSAGARVATAHGRLVGPDDTLYAHASTTCLIFDALPPARV